MVSISAFYIVTGLFDWLWCVFMVFNVILLLFVNYLKDFFVIYRLPDDWYYPWNHGRTYDLSLDFYQQLYIYIYACIFTAAIDDNSNCLYTRVCIGERINIGTRVSFVCVWTCPFHVTNIFVIQMDLFWLIKMCLPFVSCSMWEEKLTPRPVATLERYARIKSNTLITMLYCTTAAIRLV